VAEAAAKKSCLEAGDGSGHERLECPSGCAFRKQANVRRLQQLQSFEKIHAPFDGVITARNTDIGDLIQAGENTTPQELFHLSDINRLLVFVPVPEVYQVFLSLLGRLVFHPTLTPGSASRGR
jgi:multidrug efflux pump subunit AcrA (membrane-fusion protein)